MLQAMRNKMHGWPSIILLGIATFAMSFFGMGDYLSSSGDTSVAKVGKQEISQSAYQDRVNQLRQQASEQQGDKFDSKMFQSEEVKQQILDAMVDQQLLLQANDDWGMRVADSAVRDYIAAIPAFQLNHQFDPATYRSWLASQRKTPGTFESDIRSSLATQLLPDAITNSTVVSDTQVDQFLALLEQQRDLRYFVLPRPTLADSEVTDAQIAAYYKSHIAQYMNPEQVSVKYLEVDGAALPADAPPSDDDLKKLYASEQQRFVQPEQRLASHILISVPTNATPEQQKAALAKAEKIAAEANPADFAKLAEQDSDDLGSKRQGGDLGWLEKGVTTPAFDEAMFALSKGQVSKPVLSTDGYHIIWLRDVRSGASKPFAEVRDELVKEMTSKTRDHKYNEVAGKLADSTYENPSSLEPAAAAVGMPIKTSPLFSRQGGAGILSNPKLIAAAFGDDVLVQGNNSALIDLGNDHSVVLHLDKHVPAAARPLADVRADVQQKIIGERTLAAEKKQSDELLARLRKGDATMDALASSLGVTVTTTNGAVRGRAEVPPVLLKQAFLLAHPAAGKSEFAAVDMQDGSYALLAVDKVQSGDLSKIAPEQREALRHQMGQAYGNEATRELVDVLRSKTKIKLNKSLM